MQDYSFLARIDLLLYSFLLLILLCFHLVRRPSKESVSTGMYLKIVISLAVVIALEIPVWTAGPGNLSFRPLFSILLYITLSLSSLPTVAWMSYLDYKIFQDYPSCRKRTRYYLLMTAVIALIVFYNQFNRGFVFLLDETNHIVWGPGSILIPVVVYITTFLVLANFFRRKKMIHGRIIQTMLLYLLMPFAGSLLQMVFKELSLNWPFYALAVLMNYLILESREKSKDELTHLSSRTQLEERLKFKIRNSEPFSIIMADMDDFKMINDSFGHMEGDLVLKRVASILKADTNPEDMVCRFGGDEFLILIESEIDSLAAQVVSRIRSSLEELNRKQSGYRIGMSFGSEFIAHPEGRDISSILGSIDARMYEDKKRRKSLLSPSGSGASAG